MFRSFAWISTFVAFFISLGALAEETNHKLPPRHYVPNPVVQSPEDPPPRALVLPARTSVEAEVDGAAIDVLLTSGLEDLGVKVVDQRKKRRSCDSATPKMDKARASYLDLNLEEALDQAGQVRRKQLEAHGDLLGCRDLTEAELFMVQVLLDLGRKKEAMLLAEQILARQPLRRLDPAKYTPAMLALWAEVIRRKAGDEMLEPDSRRLSALGREAGVEWVVVGTCAGSGSEGEHLSVLVVPVDQNEGAKRHLVTLGSQGQWATSVREALAIEFPPTTTEMSQDTTIPIPAALDDSKSADSKKVWYRSWWFWTAVGAVVVGGTAGAIGGYYANQDSGRTDIESQFDW